MSEKFTWVSFYKELAEKILAYKENRKELMKIIYSLPAQYTNYLQWKPSDGTGVENPEIDPFSIFGIFNRQITDKNRIEILSQFKDSFHINADIPHDFNGIPVFDNRRSFFETENTPEWNEELSNKFWDLYESAIIHSDNFSSCFDEITKLKGISYGITFVLYFLNPDVYIALDGNNRKYLSNFGVELATLPTGIQYLNLLDEVKEKMKSNVIPEKTFLDFSYTAWKGDYAMPTTNNYDDYVKLLKSNHNIILHGAPGTGKTYLAKEIAKAMGAEEDNIGFVQFHPSYDYTDFVEGLRPRNGDDGQIGFERKDGVFKEFCKRAVKSIKNSESQVDNFDESWKNLVDYLNENDNMDISLLSGKGTFPIELNEYGTGLATRTYMDETREDWISGKSKFFSKDQLYNIYKGLPGVPMGGHDNYRKAIVKTMKEKFGLLDYDASQASIKALDFDSLNFEEKKEVIKRYLISNTSIYIDKDFWSNPVKILRDKESFSFQLPVEKGNGIHDLNFEDIINAKKNDDNKILQYTILNNAKNSYIPKNIRKNFIFIIDEINRGEISKIFGELFFSIDPGYRGEKGLVQTQYQNLVEEGDIFKKGFFVPENVYIIGTMNDIDRSVESMDFAMRRRFVFKEITAAQSAENMNLGDEARRRMSALNDAISKIDGLGSSYHIGAAYFLKNKIPISTEEEFNELWELRLESLLTEYLRGTGNEDKIKDLKAAYEKGESNSDDSGSDE